MFICCNSNKKAKRRENQNQQSIQQKPNQTKYQIRVSIEQDQHSTNLTNIEGTSDKMNFSSQDVERFIIDGRKTIEQERELVMRLIELPEKTHLIEFNWAFAYSNYIKDERIHPGEITNNILVEKLRNIKELVSEKDYVLVNEQVWNMLVHIYKGGPMLTIHDLDRINLEKTLRGFSSPPIVDLDKKQNQFRLLSQLPVKEIQIVGLENENYFCYLNSVLQCLMGIRQLNHFLLYSYNQEVQLFTQAYTFLLKKANKKHYKGRVSPNELIKILEKHFSIYEMHDKELSLKNQLQTTTFIDELFQGQITSFMKCPYCNKTITHQEVYFDLSLPLLSKSFIQRKLTINECLSNYFKEEIIDGEWRCSVCNQQSKNIKRGIKISSAPNILILHLKRFQNYPLKKKIKEPVNIDMEINIKNYCCTDITDTKYDLSAMIVHSGTIDEGHYVAVVKRNQQVIVLTYKQLSFSYSMMMKSKDFHMIKSLALILLTFLSIIEKYD
ncbi:unnamed protein product (macronuclear) [Paramecium tetraurelia]|uniref:Uncharacterized protein n=1 Tax=Paramecium tetraurelia TaxID=5888 RepID=A0DL05_PARTE|nr:uncharacterized protein GSPATT00018039001 [Paramecium tetraurelia]CAK83722.1 unnamed protein product [Paramecium tetraurelia]|eukprot:XP_001451119.1 hypothetical protein (macronuclear) [Paramecium tetraurelia strain d4-2]